MRKIPLLCCLLLTMPSWGQQLCYNRPAQFFEEALVIGNGTLGGTVYSNTRCDRISLNDITLWTGEPDCSSPDSAACAIALQQVREALSREDYRAADSFQRCMQGHYSENYQPLGQLHISYGQSPVQPQENSNFDCEYGRYRRWLDLSEAVAGCSYRTGADTHRRTDYFCSHPDQAMVVRITSNRPISAVLRLECQLPHRAVAYGSELIVDGYAAYHSLPHYTYAPQMFWYDSARGIHFRTIVKVLGAAHVSAQGDSLMVQGSKEVVLLVANATSFNGFDKDPVLQGADYKTLVRNRIDAAAKKSYRQLLRRHRQDYRQYYGRVELCLGRTADSVRNLPTDLQLRRYSLLNEANPELEATYFQFARYLLISCSRTPSVPANLQGLWNEHLLPPWSSNYTANINLEENYWPAEAANLGEMHEPLLSFLEAVAVNGCRVARQYYGVRQGWCLAHNTDIWAMANPVGFQSGDPVWACWNMGGAWLSNHIWEHFRYGLDTAALRRRYPVLRDAARFCMGWLVEHQGELITSPATSPENKYLTPDRYSGATLYGATADMAIVRECLANARSAAQVLGVDTALCHHIDSLLPRLAPYRIGAKGNLQEWYHDWEDAEPAHRHQSHLFGLYPGHSIDPDADTQLVSACRRTLELRGTESTGWSTGWRINLYARMADGEAAYAMYRRLLRYVSPDGYQGADARRGGGTYPNLLDAHSPFQIDGNFGGCAGICELLQQIALHPEALPRAWQRGQVRGLRLPGNRTLSMKWRSGRIVACKIR